jgi:hypothetical protein
MSQLEKLGLMRNPELSDHYVMALLKTPSKNLNLAQSEHADILAAAAINPALIEGSRMTGREPYALGGGYAPPSKTYGDMWNLCLEKWLDEGGVCYLFLKYIQTTPDVKSSTYKRLLGGREGTDYRLLREAVIQSCGPFLDKAVLKLAWDDPDEGCRGAARERVGTVTKQVGVNDARR